MSESPDETATPEAPVNEGAAAAPGGDGVDDLLPVLPKGDPLFDGIPTRAVVLEELAPALGDGALVVRRSGQVGVVLIRERNLFETYCFSATERLFGQAALDRMKSWTDATVSAYRLEPELVDVCPSLLRGDSLYSDLRLGWTDWNQLLADLAARDGNFVVEVRTPKGRGVTCIANGKQIATFTEAHPELGPPSLLDALAAARSGSIFVHSEPAVLDETTWTTVSDPTPAAPAPAAAAAPTPEPITFDPAPEPRRPIPTFDVDPDNVVDDAVANPFAAAVPRPATADADPKSDEHTNPFAAVFGGDKPAAAPASGGPVSIATLLPDLKDIARTRLARSATRVETMLDEAAADDKPLDDVLEEIRSLVIRGVMQSTLDEVVDDMRNLAASHAA